MARYRCPCSMKGSRSLLGPCSLLYQSLKSSISRPCFGCIVARSRPFVGAIVAADLDVVKQDLWWRVDKPTRFANLQDRTYPYTVQLSWLVVGRVRVSFQRLAPPHRAVKSREFACTNVYRNITGALTMQHDLTGAICGDGPLCCRYLESS